MSEVSLASAAAGAVPAEVSGRLPAVAAPRLPLRIVFGWGLGCFAASTMYQATTVLLLRYLITYVGLAAPLAGTLIGVTKLYDGVADPLIGALSDRTRTRWGRRRPYILLGGLASALTFVGLFSLPYFDGGGWRTVIAATFLMANTTAYALLSIPQLAMPAEMTQDFHERTFLMSFRVGGLALAQLSGSVLGPFIIAHYGGATRGHAMMGVLLGALIGAVSVASFFATRGAPATLAPPSSQIPWRGKLKLALGNRPFVILIAAKLSNLIAVSWYFALLPFLFNDVMRVGYGKLAVYFLFQGVTMLCAQPFLVALSRRIGKKRLFYFCACAYGLVVASWSLAAPGDPLWHAMLRAVAIGFFGGGTLLATTALLPDAIAYDFTRTGLRREGVFAGVFTTVEKVAAAVAAVLVSVALRFGGYIEGAQGAAIQPASAIAAIRGSTLAPIFCCLMAAFWLTAFTLPEQQQRSSQTA
jgi:GPH family glycoside/pentoside/hexuronide:cation symporter